MIELCTYDRPTSLLLFLFIFLRGWEVKKKKPFVNSCQWIYLQYSKRKEILNNRTLDLYLYKYYFVYDESMRGTQIKSERSSNLAGNSPR